VIQRQRTDPVCYSGVTVVLQCVTVWYSGIIRYFRDGPRDPETAHTSCTRVCYLAAVVIPWCCSGAPVMFPWCYSVCSSDGTMVCPVTCDPETANRSGDTMVLQWYSSVLQWWYHGVTVMLQSCSNGVTVCVQVMVQWCVLLYFCDPLIQRQGTHRWIQFLGDIELSRHFVVLNYVVWCCL
jgi:hypothetical protein